MSDKFARVCPRTTVSYYIIKVKVHRRNNRGQVKYDSSGMDAIGMDLQLSDRANEEYNKADEVTKTSETRRQSYTDSSSSNTKSTSYQISSDLATGTTVPVSDLVLSRDEKWSKLSNSSTSSTSSNESRMIGSSLYAPEYLTPSISYDRQTPNQLLIAIIGRAFDQPEKLASLLQELVGRIPNTETPVAKFTPFTVKRKTLCRGNFDSGELKKHDLICMCYNASEARILITGQDGYYTTLLRQTETLMGEYM